MWYIQQLLCAFPLITWSRLGLFLSYAFFPTWTGFMNVSPPFFPPDTGFRFSPPHPLLSKLFSSSTLPLPDLLDHGSLHHTQLPSLSECCWIKTQDPLTELLAFICGVIKMLHKQVSGLSSFTTVFAQPFPEFCQLFRINVPAGRALMRVICCPPFSSWVCCNTRCGHKGVTQPYFLH